MENAPTKLALRQALAPLNEIMGIFLGLALSGTDGKRLAEYVGSLDLSDRLKAFIQAAASLREALKNYKTTIMEQLAVTLRSREDQKRSANELDDELFSMLLPDPISPLSEAEVPPIASAPAAVPPVEVGLKKRSASSMENLTVIPKKKSSIPALASLAQVIAENTTENTPKKKILMTRERLRRSMHDPRGLLDLADSSTSALDRTKKLELLKSAGFGFNSQGNKSFSDRLNAAILRLELGLGGHSTADSLLFGAKVLSSPRSLTKKNISDIENIHVDGATTWKHQDAYVKRLIAGCINQSKRIFLRYDGILYGPAPELLVGQTHKAISALLGSDECRSVIALLDSPEDTAAEERDSFIKRVIEAVAPVLPITLRDKALDGGYLRTALHLLGAAEFLFKQYENDIRREANPAGAVGMCSAMHAQLERAVIYDEKLKELSEFMKEMSTQYLTCFGLGESFRCDSQRSRRRSRRGRGRQTFGDSRLQNRGFSHMDHTNPAFENTFPATTGRGRGGPGGGGSASSDLSSLRARGICFDYRAGNCGRGASCRYFHADG